MLREVAEAMVANVGQLGWFGIPWKLTSARAGAREALCPQGTMPLFSSLFPGTLGLPHDLELFPLAPLINSVPEGF